MEAKVGLSSHQISPKAKLMASFDGPHIKKVQAKMTTQKLALTKVAASTWGASLNKARHVYTAVVRPAMAYSSPVLYSPKEIRGRGTAPVAKLTILQKRCLRAITGAYKATNTKSSRGRVRGDTTGHSLFPNGAEIKRGTPMQ